MLDAGSMGRWAQQILTVINDLNAAEELRSVDVLRAVGWYNENLASCKEACERKIRTQRQRYESRFARGKERLSILSDAPAFRTPSIASASRAAIIPSRITVEEVEPLGLPVQ